MALKIIRLEERIVLDAAVADAIAAVDDLTDQTDPGADLTDTGNDSGADHSADPGADNDAAAADGQADPVYVFAVSSHVDDPDVLTGAAVEGVLTYVYDGDAGDLDAILADIQDMLGGQKADSIAFASHSAIAGQFLLSGDHLVSSDTLASDMDLSHFWEGVGDLVKDGGSIDILACDAASGDEGSATLDALRDLTGVDVWGSDDATGNPDAGGDWLLEAGNVDLTQRYFDADALQDYDHVLASTWMIDDLNDTLNSYTTSYTIHDAAYAGGKWIVSAESEEDGVGRELYIYDTAADTFNLLKDINPGSDSSNPVEFTVLNNVLYFRANDGVHGAELWRSNGTEAGTVMVQDINPGAASSTPHNLCKAADRLYFAADDGTHGNELWRTVGSGTSAMLVQDINPGAASSSPQQLIEISGHLKPLGGTYLYFTANDGAHGRELWISINDSTTMVDDTNPGAASSNPQDLTIVGSTPAARSLFYTADDGTHGRELWVTNSNGPHIIRDITPGADSSLITDLCEYSGSLYFVVENHDIQGTRSAKLWWHNGYGAYELTSLCASDGYRFYHSLEDMGSYIALAALENTLFTSDAYAVKLTYSLVGTHSFTTCGILENTSTPYDAVDFLLVDGALFGITNGVNRITNSGIDGEWAMTGDATVIDDHLYFQELWGGLIRVDATGGKETVNVVHYLISTGSSSPRDIVNAGGTLYFYAEVPGVGSGLWKSDGTKAGTSFVKEVDIYEGSCVVMNNKLYFVADNELWTTDGTAAGTVSIVNNYEGIDSDGDLYLFNGELYFRAYQGAQDIICKSDGTEAGTEVIAPANEVWGYTKYDMAYLDNSVYYILCNEWLIYNVMRTDVSQGVTKKVTSIIANTNDIRLFTAGNVLYIRDENGFSASDGTQEGTVRIKELSNIESMTEYNGQLYFQCIVGGVAQLWTSDGTEAGTVMVKELGGDHVTATPMSVVNGLMYFTATDGTHGEELWFSDGTEAGTVLLKDINSGSGSSSPTGFTLLDGHVYFSADDGTLGRELWRTDGTEVGTVLVKDVQTGSESGLSSDVSMATLGAQLLFAADDGDHGIELWAYASIAMDDDFTFYEDVGTFSGNLFADNGNGADSTSLGSLSLYMANGMPVGFPSSLGGGTLTVLSNGNFTFATNGSFDHLDGDESATLSFDYMVQSGGVFHAATVTFTIQGRNEPPVVVGEGISATENDGVTLPGAILTFNDHDPEGGPVHLESVAATSSLGAAVTYDADTRMVRYDPSAVSAVQALNAGQTMTDTFTYVVADQLGATTTGTVTVTIQGQSEPPEITGISDWSTTENAANAGYQLVNSGAVTVTDADSTNCDGAQLTVSYSGSPLAEDSLTLREGEYSSVHDDLGGVTYRQSLRLSGGHLYYIREVRFDGSTTWAELENFSFADVTSNGRNGVDLVLTFNANATKSLMETAVECVAYANDSDTPAEYRTLSYTLSEVGSGSSAAVQQEVRVTPDNDDPTGVNDTASTNKAAALTIPGADLAANDTDPEGDDLSVVAVAATSSKGATVTLNGNGDVVYDPTTSPTLQGLAHAVTATDTFTYTVSDGHGGTGTGTVTVTVMGSNEAPDAVADGYSTGENTAFTTGSVLANDTDPDNDGLVVSGLDATGALGAVTDNGDGTFDYDPGNHFEYLAVGETATDTFTYTVSDGLGGTATATVTITITGENDDPTGVDDTSFSTDEDTAFTTGSVLTNDTDPDGDSLSVLSVNTAGTKGTVISNGDGTFNYDPNGQFEALARGATATDTFKYTMSDGHGGTDTATVTITITGVQEAPTAVDDSGYSVDVGTLLNVAGPGVLANDVGDGCSVSVGSYDAVSALGATVTVDLGTGAFSYDPSAIAGLDVLAQGESVTDTFTYLILDQYGIWSEQEATVSIQINGVNDAPEAVDQFVITAGDSPVGGNLCQGDDVDHGAVLSLDSVAVAGATYTFGPGASEFTVALGQGTLHIRENGDYLFSPGAGYGRLGSGQGAVETFSFMVHDEHGALCAAPGTVTLTVTGVARQGGPVHTPGGLHLGWALRDMPGFDVQPGVWSPGPSRFLGFQSGLSARGWDIDLEGHGETLAQGLRLLGNSDLFGPPQPPNPLRPETYLEHPGQAAAAFNDAVDSLPGVSQLARIALKNFNADILDLLLGGHDEVALGDLQALADHLADMIGRMGRAEMAQFHGMLAVWLQSLKIQAQALSDAGQDSQDMDALLAQLAAMGERVGPLR